MLSQCLAHIKQIEFAGEWELIVVDNGSSDNTAEIVSEFASKADFPVRYVYEERRGLSNARNSGVKAARGEIIAFTDDDCIVASNFLSETLLAFSKDPRVGYITGLILLHNPEHYRATINESAEPAEFQPFSYIKPGDVKGANLSFRAIVLNEINGFDPLFGSGALFPAEDCEAVARASTRGWRGQYTPTVVVRHDHGRTKYDIENLLRAYDIGRGAYHSKLFRSTDTRIHALRGWAGLFRRAVRRPTSVFWELKGAAQYFFISRQYHGHRPLA